MDKKQRNRAIEQLIQTNFEFKKLHQEHQTLEAKIEALDKQKYLSVEEERLRKELQKKKLTGKDQMEKIVTSSLSLQA